VLLEGWSSFHEPVESIVFHCAFEHFGSARYDAFFKKTTRRFPTDGKMLLHEFQA